MNKHCTTYLGVLSFLLILPSFLFAQNTASYQEHKRDSLQEIGELLMESAKWVEAAAAFSKAIDHIDRAIELDPITTQHLYKRTMSQVHLSEVYRNNGEMDRALQVINKAREQLLDKTYGNTHQNVMLGKSFVESELSNYYIDNDNLSQAIVHQKKRLALLLAYPEKYGKSSLQRIQVAAYHQLGSLQRNNGDHLEAIESYTEGMKLSEELIHDDSAPEKTRRNDGMEALAAGLHIIASLDQLDDQDEIINIGNRISNNVDRLMEAIPLTQENFNNYKGSMIGFVQGALTAKKKYDFQKYIYMLKISEKLTNRLIDQDEKLVSLLRSIESELLFSTDDDLLKIHADTTLQEYPKHQLLKSVGKKKVKSNPEVKKLYSAILASHAYYSILEQNFKEAVKLSKKSIKYYEDNIYSPTNLASGYLLGGKLKKAKQVYEQYANQKFDPRSAWTYAQEFQDDLETFEEKMIIPESEKANVASIKSWLEGLASKG